MSALRRRRVTVPCATIWQPWRSRWRCRHAFVGVLLWRFADAERARLEARLGDRPGATLAVDRELAGLISMTEVISPSDRSGR